MVKLTVSYHTIEASQAGQRIDNFLTTKLKGLPKSRLYRLVRKGEVRVNKKRIKPDYRLQLGDVVRIPPISLAQPKHIPQDRGLFKGLVDRIIYQDDYLLAINKPHGIPVHGGTRASYGVIECLRVGFGNEKLELIHRIDKATSGCLLIAKTRQALKYYQQAFREGLVQKRYQALCHGHWPQHLQKIDLPLLRKPSIHGDRRVIVSSAGQSAISYIKATQCFPGASLLEIRIVTGRTHQIRVHTASQKHPIVGDGKYGSEKLDKSLLKTVANRMYLHAFSLKVPQFEQHQNTLLITAKPSNDWCRLLDKLAENC